MRSGLAEEKGALPMKQFPATSSLGGNRRRPAPPFLWGYQLVPYG
jgi:hypothetical protein